MKGFAKIVVALSAIMLFMTFVGEVVMHLFFSQYMFKGHLFIPLYFWFFYLLAAYFAHRPMSNMEFTRFLLGFKALKMFVSMVFVTLLAFFLRDEVVAIILNFAVYYLLLLVPECIYSIYLKKNIKN